MPPVELLRRVVEDWVTPAEVVDDVEVTAWRRFGEARRAWLDAHDVDHVDECRVVPRGRLRFRDPAAFFAGVNVAPSELRHGARIGNEGSELSPPSSR